MGVEAGAGSVPEMSEGDVLLCDCHRGCESLYRPIGMMRAGLSKLRRSGVKSRVKAREICGFVGDDIWHSVAIWPYWHMVASLEMVGRGAVYAGIEMLCC